MQHPYLLLSDSEKYEGKLLVGEKYNSDSSSLGCGLTDKNVKIVNIPSTFNGKEITEIGAWAFKLTNITSVFIPKTVLCIYRSAFEACRKLSEVRFEEGSKLESFGECVFYYCRSLKKIDFPTSVTSISISSGFAFFFYEAKLECFSYAGTTDFSLLNRFFSSETNIYVSEEYPSTYFASL